MTDAHEGRVFKHFTPVRRVGLTNELDDTAQYY
jgi:hypothetical protein